MINSGVKQNNVSFKHLFTGKDVPLQIYKDYYQSRYKVLIVTPEDDLKLTKAIQKADELNEIRHPEQYKNIDKAAMKRYDKPTSKTAPGAFVAAVYTHIINRLQDKEDDFRTQEILGIAFDPKRLALFLLGIPAVGVTLKTISQKNFSLKPVEVFSLFLASFLVNIMSVAGPLNRKIFKENREFFADVDTEFKKLKTQNK